MNSVLCTNLIKFLISKGANVNAIGFDSPSLCCQGWVGIVLVIQGGIYQENKQPNHQYTCIYNNCDSCL